MDKRDLTCEGGNDGLHGAPSTGIDPMLYEATAAAGNLLLRNEEPQKLLAAGSRRKGIKPKRSVSWAHVSTHHEEGEPGFQLPTISGSNGNGGDLDSILRHYGLENKTENNEATSRSMTTPRYDRSTNAEHSHRLFAFGISLSTAVSDIILVYPCLVLRRQCQVSNMGRRYHFTPFTIIGVAVSLQRSQGVTCLWKGAGSHLMISALGFGVESGVSEMTAKLPREISRRSSFKDLIGHIILKSLSTAILLPFYSAHLVESIQSEKASDTPGLLFFITEGFSRLFGFAGVQSPRMLPFRQLLLPTVLFFLLKYILSSTLQHAILVGFRYRERQKHEQAVQSAQTSFPSPAARMSVALSSHQSSARPTELLVQASPANTQQQELLSTFISQLVTDVVLYPYETVLYRLHVQGTRTIIDDMDRGSGFLPVSSRYEGFLDCWSTSRSYEGSGGLYRGFGALILQYAVKFSVVKLMQFVLQFSGKV